MSASRSRSFPPLSRFWTSSSTLYSVTNLARLTAWLRVAAAIERTLDGHLDESATRSHQLFFSREGRAREGLTAGRRRGRS